MFWMLLFPAIVLVVVFWCGGPPLEEGRDVFVLALVLTVFIAFGSSMLGLAVASGIGSNLRCVMDEEPAQVESLTNLRSFDGVTGRIGGGLFVIAGYINSDLYYTYYVRSGDAVTPRSRRVGKGTYVYEQDRRDGQLHRVDWHFARQWWKWFAYEDCGSTWNFYVPKGTVSTEFGVK